MQKILLVEPRKSKGYYTQYPPLGLLKLATYHKQKGDWVWYTREREDIFEPDVIYITSLFTYAWKAVHEVIRYYSQKYKKAEIVVGGIYATLCEDYLRDTFKDRIWIHRGLCEEVEDVMPDYLLVPNWDASILFASRGCIRSCPFCVVNRLEPTFSYKKSIKHLLYPGHRKVILWDNNILASPYWEDIFQELEGFQVDFNQGLDARLIIPEAAMWLKRLKIRLLRLAYDTQGMRKPLKRAIDTLKEVGFRGRQILVYCLYNFVDTPDSFLARIQDLIEWDVVSYPMRYEPFEADQKNAYIAPCWTPEQLEMVAKARRVLGYGGAFPPHEGLKKKFLSAKSFEEAFELKPLKNTSKIPRRC